MKLNCGIIYVFELFHHYIVLIVQLYAMSERSVLKMFALGLIAQSIRVLSFRTDFTIHEIVISIVNQPIILSQTQYFGTKRRY